MTKSPSILRTTIQGLALFAMFGMLLQFPCRADEPEVFYKMWPNGLVNSGTRYDKYCYVGKHICFEEKSSCMGQCCHAPYDFEATHEYGAHYISWRCLTDNPNNQPPGGKSGK